MVAVPVSPEQPVLAGRAMPSRVWGGEVGSPAVQANAKRQARPTGKKRLGGSLALPMAGQGAIGNPRFRPATLDHVAMHVGEPKVPTLVLERQPRVVDARQVQRHRLEVVD